MHLLPAPQAVEVHSIGLSVIAASEHYGECYKVPLHAGTLHTAAQLQVDLGQRGENVAVLQ